MKHKKSDYLYYIFIVFISTIILSMSFFFAGGEVVEKSLANSLDLSMSYKDDHYFSDTSSQNLYEKKPKLYQKVTDMFIQDIEELCKDTNVNYANYSLLMNVYIPEQDTCVNDNLYRIRDKNYFERNEIQLEDCSAEDLAVDTVILPDRMKKQKISIGSIYSIQDSTRIESKKKDLTVIDFYKNEQWGKEDVLSKYMPAIVTNDTILSILKENIRFYGCKDTEASFGIEPIKITYISFQAKDIDGYNEFVGKLNAFSLEENRKFAKTLSDTVNDGSLGLQANVSRFGSVLKSIQRVKILYEVIFVGIWTLLLVAMFRFISFLQKKNAMEIGIRKALGERKRKTIGFYIRYYVYPAIPVLIIGDVCGYFFANVISYKISSNHLEIQKQMQNIIGNINGFKDSLVFEVGSMVRVMMVSVL